MIGNGIRGRIVAVALVVAALVCSAAPLPGSARAAERVGGDFTLERLDLRFVGGEKVKVIAAGQAVRAEVEITFAGTGQLGGAWEIAGPTTTSGSPQYRTLELVNRLLGMGRREVLASPPLPTAMAGAYLLRLRVTSPEVPGPPPALRYFVGLGDGGPTVAGAAPGTLAASGPASGGAKEGTKFSWRPVPGSIAYQLELYEKDGAAPAEPADAEDQLATCLVNAPSGLGRLPVAGMMVPGDRTDVELSPAVAKRLGAGRTFLWRVLALDRDGKVICDSPLRELAR